MLACGEDLGMMPSSVHDVMNKLDICKLSIQRVSTNHHIEFSSPAYSDYLSVVSPSCHDMATLREWWEESPERTQRFYNRVLGAEGGAPFFCEPHIVRMILEQVTASPAFLAIMPIQDIVAMSASFRYENPKEERINEPGNALHYWRYRIHFNVEDLLEEKENQRGFVKDEPAP